MPGKIARKPSCFAALLELRARIGGQHEVTSASRLAERLHRAMEKVLLQDVHLEGRPRFRCDEKQRPAKIDCPLHREDLSGIGRVDDVQVWIAFGAADDLAHHLGRRLEPPIPSRTTSLMPLGPDFVGELRDRAPRRSDPASAASTSRAIDPHRR